MNILDGRKSFYQWDLNQKITSEKFKVGDEIHFHNVRQSEALVVLAYEFDGKVVADVPNILLSTPLPIHAYVYVTEDTACKTIYEKIFTVEQRAKPSDYVYSETELYTITTAVNKALKDAKESGEFDGVSVTHSWNGTVLTINSASGTSSSDLKGKDAVIDQVYNPESENAQSGIATASAIANSHVKYVESLNDDNLLNLFELESGTYVLSGKFRPYPDAPNYFTFLKYQLVSVSKGSKTTCVQVFDPPYNAIQYLNIYPDTESETGYTCERKDAKLYYMEDIRNKKTSINEYSSDFEYPSSKCVYTITNGLDTRIKEVEKALTATTLAGYGITDAYTKSEVDGKLGYIETALDQIIALENSYIGGESA